jgi:hypothetical protein
MQGWQGRRRTTEAPLRRTGEITSSFQIHRLKADVPLTASGGLGCLAPTDVIQMLWQQFRERTQGLRTSLSFSGFRVLRLLC